MKHLTAKLALFLSLFTAAAWADTDEAGLTPTIWWQFKDSALVSKGSTNYAPALPTDGSYVETGDAWKFGTSSSASLENGSTGYSQTYHVVMNTFGNSYSGKAPVTWGGKAVGGIALKVDGSKVSLVWHANNALATTDYVAYNLPEDKASDYHAYTIVIGAQNTTMDFYVDGVLIGKSTTMTKAGNSGWRLGNVYNGSVDLVPQGLAIKEIRMYNAALNATQAAQIAGTYHALTSSVTETGTTSWSDLKWTTSDGTVVNPSASDACTLNLATGAAVDMDYASEALLSLTVNGGTLNIPEGNVLTVDALAGDSAITGAGRLICKGFVPSNATQKTSLQDADNWTGTVEIQDYANLSQLPLNVIGNANSTVCYNGVSGYLAATGTHASFPLYTRVGALEIGEKGLTMVGTFSNTDMKVPADLKGTGTITVTSAGGTSVVRFVGDASAFAGSITTTTSSGHSIVFQASDTSSVARTDTSAASIVVSADASVTIASGKTWTTTNGVVVNGDLDLQGAISGGALKGSGTVKVANSAKANTVATNLQATTWAGTLWCNGFDLNSGISGGGPLASWGNSGSKIKFTGCYGWIASGTVTAEVVLENDSNGRALEIDDGSSGSTWVYCFNKISGTGTLALTKNTSYTFRPVRIEDVSDFTGSISVLCQGVIIGTGATNTTTIPNDNVDVYNKKITLLKDSTATIASGKTWTATSGIVVNGTLNNNGTIASAVTGGGRIVQSALPTGDTYLTSLQNTAWTGTLAIAAQSFTDSTQVTLNNFGNTGSTIELLGLSGSSVWLPNNANIAATVDVKGDVTFNNGGSGSTYTFSKITGDHNFGLTAWTGCYGVGLSVSAFDHYTGTVALKNNSTHANGCVETLTVGNIIVDDYAIETPVLKVTQACTSTATKYSTAINLSSATLNGKAAKLAVASDGIYVAVASVTSGGTTTYYATLADAVAAVGNDALDTIVVLEDGATVPEGYVVKDGKVSLKKLDTILPGTLTWLPVGDSITEGEQYMGHPDQGTAETRGGYRYQLWKMLTDQGQATKSVGFRSGHSGTVEPDTCDWAWHGGMYGGVISPMTCSNKKYGSHLFNVESFLEVSGYPDIISIMIGINDLSFCKDVETTFAAWTQLVDKYAKLRPNSKIVVSTLLPVTTTNVTSPYWGPFNEKVRAAATAKTAPFDNTNVIFADVAKAAFNDAFSSGYFKGDGIHPNETGAKIVAKAFLEQGFIPAMEAIAAESVKVAQVNNGTAGKLTVRLSKAAELSGDATLKLTGNTIDGDGVDLTLENGTIAADKKTITFDTDYTFENGSYTATLTVGNAAIAADGDTVYDIVGSGAAANVKADYMSGFQKYQDIAPESTSQTVDTKSLDMTGRTVTKVGYYMELKRAGEAAQFVWVSMNAATFGNDLTKVGVPTTTTGTIKAIADDVTVFGNRGNFTKDVTGGTAVVEFTPYSYTAADQTGDNCVADASPNGAFGWNDTLGSSGSYGCMQVARITGDTRSATTPTAEMLFAYNAFNNSAASDIGIGSLSTHRNNAGGSIDAVYDWTWITATAQLSKFMMTAYETKKIEVWVELEVTDPVAEIDGVKYATLADACEAAKWGDTITLLKDVALTTENESIPAGVTIAGAGNIIVNGMANLNGVAFAADYTGKIILQSGTLVLDKADAVTVEDADYASESAVLYVVVSGDDFLKGGYTMGLAYTGSKTVSAIASVGGKSYTETVTATEGVYAAPLRTLQWNGTASTWANWYDEGVWCISSGSTTITTTWKEGDTNPVVLAAGDCVNVDNAATPASVTVSGTSYIKGYANLGTTPITLSAALVFCGNEQVTTPLKGSQQVYFDMSYASEPASTDIITSDVLTDFSGFIFLRNGVYTFTQTPPYAVTGSTKATVCIADGVTIDKTIGFGTSSTAYGDGANLHLGAGVKLKNTGVISFNGCPTAPVIEVDEGSADLSMGGFNVGNVTAITKTGVGTLIVAPTTAGFNVSQFAGGITVKEGAFQIGRAGGTWDTPWTLSRPVTLDGGMLAMKGSGTFTISELDLAELPESNTCIAQLNGASSSVTKVVAPNDEGTLVDVTAKITRVGNDLYYDYAPDPTSGDEGDTTVTKNTDGSVTVSNATGSASIAIPSGCDTVIKVAGTVDTLLVASGTLNTNAEKLVILSRNGTVINAYCKVAEVAGGYSVALDPNAEGLTPTIQAEDATSSTKTDPAAGKVVTSAIPGLTYTLKRAEKVGEVKTGATADSQTAGATATTVTLTDQIAGEKPSTAFYSVEVTK